ncbi:MAG TPA: hypothetical protein VKZ99_09685 [Gammaproteobacteria bacterium]|nr:hypothetical protein [Gammaproteobacteria bacterium]
MTREMLENTLNNLSLRTYLVIALVNGILLMGGLALIYYGDQIAALRTQGEPKAARELYEPVLAACRRVWRAVIRLRSRR